ncbi:MAG: hypothetical protein KF750_11475 [Xanthobacteraceae bacterium]|nr:hypothetical protein [Xanthobacteraceae bacterium]
MRFEPDGSKAREHWRTLTPSKGVATHMPERGPLKIAAFSGYFAGIAYFLIADLFAV